MFVRRTGSAQLKGKGGCDIDKLVYGYGIF